MDLQDIMALAGLVAGFAAVLYLDARRNGKRPAPQGKPKLTPLRIYAFSTRRYAPFKPGAFPVTLAFIGICLGVALASNMGQSAYVLMPLLISDPDNPSFREILSGQVWRLITPAFIHFGPMHLVFNLFWLWDLGGTLERIQGSRFILAFVMGVGIIANLAQYILTGSAAFGGMSGVLYGFIGYVWMQNRTNPAFPVRLSNETLVILLGWYALCWLGVLGPVANWAHTAGLAAGAALGARRAA